jgi:hypothetical protein
MLLVLTVVLYLCTVLGSGRYDIISVLMIFSSMLLLNAVWFFDVSINATTEIWLKERGRRIMLGLAAFLSCVTSALMLSSFLRIRFPRAEEGVSTLHLLFAAILSMAILLHRYGSGSWRDVIIQSPWGEESESSKRKNHKKSDGDNNASSNGSALGRFKFVKRVMQKEVFLSLKWSALIVVAAISGIFVARNAYADTLSETLCEQLHLSGNNGNDPASSSSSSSSLDTMVTGLIGNTTATLCKEFREESGVHNVYTLSLLFQAYIMVALIQLVPLMMFASLKVVVFSPVSFIAPPAYEGGAVESTSSLRKSQSNASDAAVAGERADKLTSAMAFGSESIRRKVPTLSWQVDHNSGNGGGGGDGSGGYSASSSSSVSSFDRARAAAAATASAPIRAPRWQEALYVYRAIQAELVASVKAPYLGPPVVPYLQNGGYGFGMLGGGSGSGGTIGIGAGGRLLTIMRALAMEDFALVLSSRTWGLVQCRKQLFARGWCDAIVAALTFVSATTLQVQIVTCHAMEEVLEHQQQYREERQAARDQQQRSNGSGSSSSSSGSNSSSKGEDAYKFNQIMGGHFQVKNLDRVSGIPQAVVRLIRAGRDRVDGSVLGYLGNKMLRAWAGFAWARPLLRALYARYPFSHALPPFILQTCINAVRGVSKGLEHALTDDPTGMAEYHLIGAMELLIKLELSLEEYEVCMKRCHVNVFTDSNMKRVRSSGGRLSPPSGAAVYDVKSLQIEVGTAIDTLVRSFRDVLSRPDCPLLQDDSTAPVLLARIKSIH